VRRAQVRADPNHASADQPHPYRQYDEADATASRYSAALRNTFATEVGWLRFNVTFIMTRA